MPALSELILRGIKSIKFLIKRSLLYLATKELTNRGPYFGQTMEDELMEKYLPESYGTFLDIGAGRPKTHSNSFKFYSRGWRGVCVDPLPQNRKLHKFFRNKDTFVEAIVGMRFESHKFYEFEPYGYSTSDPLHLQNALKKTGVKLVQVLQLKSIKITSLPLARVRPHDPSFLTIDAEGFDLDILKSNDWSHFLPRLICIESKGIIYGFEEVELEFQKFLSAIGYLLKSRTNLSLIYVHRDFFI